MNENKDVKKEKVKKIKGMFEAYSFAIKCESVVESNNDRHKISFLGFDGKVIAVFHNVSRKNKNRLLDENRLQRIRNNRKDITDDWQDQVEDEYNKALAKGKYVTKSHFVGLKKGLGNHPYGNIKRANVDSVYCPGVQYNKSGTLKPVVLIPLDLKLEEINVEVRCQGVNVRIAYDKVD